MKLLSKFRRYSLTTLICVSVASFIANYYLFRYSIHRTTDDVLNEYRIDIENYAAEKGTLNPYKLLDMRLSTLKVDADPGGIGGKVDETIRDTLVFSHYENEMVVYRKMEFPVATPEQNYIVELMLPTLEEDDLVGTVLISLTIIVIFYILFSTITNMIFKEKIYQPFNAIMEVIRTYNINEPKDVEMHHSDIDELQELSLILKGMMDKINKDYLEMKNFLENTSHEIKTPLSIIQLKLEALNQCDINDEEVLMNLTSIRNALSRIRRFNRSLLLIAKINNNQFYEHNLMNMNKLFNKFIVQYEELLSARNITADLKQEGDFVVSINSILAEQLVQNIATNALTHNREAGKISIRINEDRIEVSNTFEGQIPQGDLFERYTHSKMDNNSNGLGLAIVKSICTKSDIKVSYHIQDDIFTIVLEKSI